MTAFSFVFFLKKWPVSKKISRYSWATIPQRLSIVNWGGNKKKHLEWAAADIRRQKCEGVKKLAEKQKGKENECKYENDIQQYQMRKRRNGINQLNTTQAKETIIKLDFKQPKTIRKGKEARAHETAMCVVVSHKQAQGFQLGIL